MERTKAFAIFKSVIWCMGLAYVDEPGKDNNSVKYLLVQQDLFDRTVNANKTKTKASEEKVRGFLFMITDKSLPK